MGLDERKQERIIDGVVYEVTPLPFGIGRRALSRFVAIAAPVIGSVMERTSTGSIEKAVASALPVLATSLTDDELSYFAKTFGNASRYQDGDRMVPLLEAQQEAHFSGRYTAFFEWLAFSVEVNFSPFFRDLIEIAKKAKSGLASQTASSSK